VFDKMVVITYRVVLDRQLQDTIYQFEHDHGVVQKVDIDITQLAEARRGAGSDRHHHPPEVTATSTPDLARRYPRSCLPVLPRRHSRRR
jgi:hypothetical protein